MAEKRGDWESLIKEAIRRGWIVERSKKHIVMRWPATGRKTTIPTTASDYRAWFNARAIIRRIEREG